MHEMSFDEVSFYVRLVDELTVDQIKILNLFYLKTSKNTPTSISGRGITFLSIVLLPLLCYDGRT